MLYRVTCVEPYAASHTPNGTAPSFCHRRVLAKPSEVERLLVKVLLSASDVQVSLV